MLTFNTDLTDLTEIMLMYDSLLMRIAIVGAGGVGGYFGGRLAAAGSDVIFLARGAHLDAMRARGLRLARPDGNLPIDRVGAPGPPAAGGHVAGGLLAAKLAC